MPCVSPGCTCLFQQPFWWLIIRIWLFLFSSFHFRLVSTDKTCFLSFCFITGVWKEEQMVKPVEREGMEKAISAVLCISCSLIPVQLQSRRLVQICSPPHTHTHTQAGMWGKSTVLMGLNLKLPSLDCKTANKDDKCCLNYYYFYALCMVFYLIWKHFFTN